MLARARPSNSAPVVRTSARPAMSVHDALEKTNQETSPNEKMPRTENAVGSMSEDNQALFKATTQFMTSEFDQKMSKVNNAMVTMADATDKGMKDLKKKLTAKRRHVKLRMQK